MAVVTVDTEACFAERNWTGVETSFAAGFKAETAPDVEVYSRDAAGVIASLTAGVHYSVTLAGDGGVTVVPIALPPAPKTILILRDTSALQGVDFQNLGQYSAPTHTTLHSRAAMRDAEDKFHRARVLAVPLGETIANVPNLAARQNGGIGSLFGFDGIGAPKLFAPGTIGNVVGPAGVVDMCVAVFDGFGNLLKRGPNLVPYIQTTPGDINVLATHSIVGPKKAVAAATIVNLGLSAARGGYPITIKDFKGDADVNPITPAFSGDELCDGFPAANFVINTKRGWMTFWPDPAGGWYQISA